MPAAIAGFEALAGELGIFDGRLAACASRAVIEGLLGTRGELLGERPWTARFGEPEATEAERVEAFGWNDGMLAGAPSDEVVTRYATSGALARYVEGFAARSPVFAEELAEVIDALRAAREPVGLTARGWRKRMTAVPGGGDALTFAARLPARLAAATGGEVEAPPAERNVRLGQLAPLPAEARLVISERSVSLRVFAEAGVIARVELDGASDTAPDATETWVVTAPLTEAPLRIRVVGCGRDVFEEMIALVEG